MNQLILIFKEIGSITLFVLEVWKTFFKTKGNAQAIYAQIVMVVSRSWSTVIFSGLFVGAILVIQFNQILAKYEAQVFLGGLNTSAVVREIGPLIISFLLAGKIGAFTAAELGTMRVTEQIDAIECLGTNPIQYLVVPRYLGILISSIILLMFGLLVSVGGAMLVAIKLCGINYLQFIDNIPQFNSPWTLLVGMIKSAMYAHIVGAVSCYKGYTTSGGARGVGRAVTSSAIYTNFYIIITNYLMAYFLEHLEALFKGGL